MKYKIALRPSKESYSVSVPGLPGLLVAGVTEEEALANIRGAIMEHLWRLTRLVRSAAEPHRRRGRGVGMPSKSAALRVTR